MCERDEKRGGLGCTITGISLILLPVLYMFGLAPAVWLANQFPACSAAANFVYYPLQLVHDNFETVGVWLDRYVALWG